VNCGPLIVPLPARPKQLLTCFFADRYRILHSACGQSDVSPRVTVVGPQTHSRAGVSVFGRIDNFTIHFQPAGFSPLFAFTGESPSRLLAQLDLLPEFHTLFAPEQRPRHD
jgi:hypothetical protein